MKDLFSQRLVAGNTGKLAYGQRARFLNLGHEHLSEAKLRGFQPAAPEALQTCLTEDNAEDAADWTSIVLIPHRAPRRRAARCPAM